MDQAINLFDGKSEAEIAYIKHIAILKATKVEELSLDEVIELGEVLSEAARLGLEVSKEVNEFWEVVSDTTRAICSVTVGVATKVVAKMVVGYLPV